LRELSLESFFVYLSLAKKVWSVLGLFVWSVLGLFCGCLFSKKDRPPKKDRQRKTIFLPLIGSHQNIELI